MSRTVNVRIVPEGRQDEQTQAAICSGRYGSRVRTSSQSCEGEKQEAAAVNARTHLWSVSYSTCVALMVMPRARSSGDLSMSS